MDFFLCGCFLLKEEFTNLIVTVGQMLDQLVMVIVTLAAKLRRDLVES